MMIKVEKIKQYLDDPEKGSSFYANNDGKPLISILKRNKGTVSGHHYHRGEAKGKNPETFVVIQGKIELYLENVKTNESQTLVIDENTLFEIPPYIYHEVKALTDFIALEFNFSEEDKEDTIEGKELK